MSRTVSNRILKSPNITFDRENVVEIHNEPIVPFVPFMPESQYQQEDIDIFDSPEDDDQDLDETAEKMLARARAEAERILQSAREDAEMILDRMEADAQAALKQLEEEAEERGYSEGYAKGVSEAEVIKEDARMLYANAVRERQETFDALEGDIVDLVTGVLDKLLTDSIDINPQVVLYLVRNAFSETKLSGTVTIHVSDADYESIYENKETLAQYADAGAEIEILKDFSLKKSDCIIETPVGAIDCSLDQQYATLRKNLYYIFENR